MNKCPICDIWIRDIHYTSMDYSTGLIFCNDHLNDAELLYRRTPLAGTTDLSAWLRCIADTRDNYHKSINSIKIHTDKVIDINKAKNTYLDLAVNLIRDKAKVLDIVI